MKQDKRQRDTIKQFVLLSCATIICVIAAMMWQGRAVEATAQPTPKTSETAEEAVPRLVGGNCLG